MVGWTGQEHGEYEVVGHLPVYRMTCFRKLSDEIWLSSSENSLCFFHTYWSIPLGNRNFLLTPSTFLTGDLFENFYSPLHRGWCEPTSTSTVRRSPHTSSLRSVTSSPFSIFACHPYARFQTGYVLFTVLFVFFIP